MARHRWHFVAVGGADHVVFATGEDLISIDELDQKLWAALAMPIANVDFDPATLAHLDTDKTGRVHAPALAKAARWTGSLLKDPDDLLREAAALELDAIDTDAAEGAAIAKTARAMLVDLGKKDEKAISVADVKAALEAFAKQPFNGDGIVAPAAASDEETKKIITDILACLTGEVDHSGALGVGAKTADEFFAAVAAYMAWIEKGEKDEAVMPLGTEATRKAYAAYTAVRAKVDDYFGRCRLAAFDPRAIAALHREEKDYLAIAAKDLTIDAAEIAGFPLAAPAVAKPLPLSRGVNPAWAARVSALASDTLVPLGFKGDDLPELAWIALREKLGAHDAWAATKQGAIVEKLGIARLRELAAPSARAAIDAILAKDKEQEPRAKSYAAVDRLVRYHRDLLQLANNFVSFREFYLRRRPAIFQAGTLYIDRRACELTVKVHDTGKHATMATNASAYLLYCDCLRPGEKITIAAAMTAGDVDTMFVGRNGLFYDQAGREWYATVTRIVDHPISVRQAFWAPYKKLLKFVEDQVARRASAADEASTAHLTTTATGVETAATEGAPTQVAAAAAPAATAPARRMDIGTVAAIGVAVGGITAAFGALLEGFFGLGMWMPLGVLGIVLLISGPSMAIAALKVRKRDLAPLLDANGWAVNAKTRVGPLFGSALTRQASLPRDAVLDHSDPYAQRRVPVWVWIVLLVISFVGFAWFGGVLDKWLPTNVQSRTLIHHEDSPTRQLLEEAP